MCETFAELKEAVATIVRGFDPGLVAPGQVDKAMQDVCTARNMLSTVVSLLAARKATLGPPTTAARQAVRDLAQASGTSLGEANRAVAAGRFLQGQPEVAAAARAGELSGQQLALVTGAAAANPDATARLLSVAKTGSLRELADESTRALATNQDLEARRQAIHAARSLRPYTDAFGVWHLHAKGTPEEGAMVMAGINPLANKAFETARRERRRESPEAYAFDGLVALATSGGTQAARTEVLVRLDHSALIRGYPIDGEVCEVAGFGPTSVQAVLDMIDTGDPFLKAVVTKGKDVVGVAHLGRRANAHQKSALDWIYPSCAVESCGTRGRFLQTDHRLDWSKTHVTILELLDRLCPFHHRLKTNQGWALIEGKGKRPFVPPNDAKHPRHLGLQGDRPGPGSNTDDAQATTPAGTDPVPSLPPSGRGLGP